MTEKAQTQKSTKTSTKASAKKSTAKKKVMPQVTKSAEQVVVNNVSEEKENDNMSMENINTINAINTTTENNDTNDVNTVTEEKENATITNETINTNTNINISTNTNDDNNVSNDNSSSTTTAAALKISGITQEQLLQILKNAGVDTTQVNITAKETKAPKINDKLTYTDESKTFAICAASSEHVFNINELDEEAKIESMKSGLCPHCLNIMKQAAEIKAASGFRTRTVTNNQPSAEKPGFKIRQIIKDNLNNIDAELLNKLQDKDFSRSNFKLAYPMLLNITGMSAEEIKTARKDAKNHDRYSPQVYTINDQQFLLTNDLYGKNLEPIANFFAKLA